MAGKPGIGGHNKGKGKGAKWVFAHVAHAGDDCLKWPFATDKRVGRGTMGYCGKLYWAHRFMCEQAHGPAPLDRPQVAHNCGNGHLGCVNPRHLEWKTNQENCQDKMEHGRSKREPGKKNLTPKQVLEIRSLNGNLSQVEIAKRFGVSLSCVQYHLHGKERWPSHGGR